MGRTGDDLVQVARDRPVLVLYGRPDCHLCDRAKPTVRAVARRFRVRVDERNVEDHPEWERAYGTQVPVAFLGDRKLFKYRVEAKELGRRLSAALRS